MLQLERQQKILDYLKENRKATTNELSELLGVSTTTCLLYTSGIALAITDFCLGGFSEYNASEPSSLTAGISKRTAPYNFPSASDSIRASLSLDTCLLYTSSCV